MTTKIHTIDATGKTIGRTATEAATWLRGKNTPAFAPNVLPDAKVTIENAHLLKITEAKKDQKDYTRYSGYPGGLTHQTLRHLIAKKGYTEVLKKAVYGMLPSNRLRGPAMKNLIINE
jgi:large subunit ribosomal protein L13